MKTNRNRIVFTTLLCVLFFTIGNAQNYRSPKAYIDDFQRNEDFLKESLIEYTAAVINISPDFRTQSTLDRIFKKLENVNTILLRNDKGMMGDVVLRDAFIKMNSRTITLLRNKVLILNDYTAQSLLDYPQILKNFAYKEKELANYYKGIIDYENEKREFALKYGITIKEEVKTKNAFESNAYQNLIFYRMNVIDEKLTALLKEKNIEKVKECFNYMQTVATECNAKTEQYKNDFKDNSLNNANVRLISFMTQQKEALLTAYINYVTASAALDKAKADATLSDSSYNAIVKQFNSYKNVFFDTLYNVQIHKKELLDSWYVTNSKWIKNNTEFENLKDKITNVD